MSNKHSLKLTTETRRLPTRMVIHGLEGAGKTSLAAHAPSVVFSMVDDETGLETLIESGQIADIAHLPARAKSWQEVKNHVHSLIVEEHDRKVYAVDTINAAERLLFQATVSEKFGGDYEKFDAFGRGVNFALSEWNEYLGLLEKLREKKNMGIILIAHTKVAPFRNPEGPDYDRYVPDLNPKTWGLAYKWADLVLFAQFETFVDENKKFARPKGKDGQTRILNTERTAAFDAKNRLGLPSEIECGDSPAQAWKNLVAAIKAAKEATQATQTK